MNMVSMKMFRGSNNTEHHALLLPDTLGVLFESHSSQTDQVRYAVVWDH
jgi:hypothetical protein